MGRNLSAESLDSEQPRTFALRKLVRDGYFERMQQDNQSPNFHIVSGDEKLGFLEDKLIEEAGEVRLSHGNREEGLKELSDLLEVIDEAASELGSNFEEVIAIKEEKRRRLGGFDGGYFVRTVRIDPAVDPELFDYYSSNPDRFPTQID